LQGEYDFLIDELKLTMNAVLIFIIE